MSEQVCPQHNHPLRYDPLSGLWNCDPWRHVAQPGSDVVPVEQLAPWVKDHAEAGLRVNENAHLRKLVTKERKAPAKKQKRRKR